MAEEESFCNEEEFHNNLLKTRLEISPALFEKYGKHAENEIKKINKLLNTLDKTGSTKSKDESYRDTVSNTMKKRKSAERDPPVSAIEDMQPHLKR